MSFWKKGNKQTTKKNFPNDPVKTVIQLDVDVYREKDRLVIYAPIYGADIGDIDIDIEGNSDVIVISGRTARPPLPPRKGRRSGDFVTAECVWGEFFRRIILPASVDVDEAEAKVQRGVLIISLPLID